VTPANFVITFNEILGEASRQLTVTGTLKDGRTIDLTSTRLGTNYNSSDTTVCNFGTENGRIYAGSDGSCTITISNSGFNATANGTIRTFAPTALSYVDISGTANSVAVNGNYAYVAGSAGFHVIDVSNRKNPVLKTTLPLHGNANDVKVVGNTAFVADGLAGLQIINITDPLKPSIISTFDTPGDAQAVVVAGNFAFIADGAGLQIINVTDPSAPTFSGSVNTPGTAIGVDVNQDNSLAVIAMGGSGIQVVNTTHLAALTPVTPRI
jgi:hypothetical protein